NGVLAYRAQGENNTRFVWLDRSGKPTSGIEGGSRGCRLSPDEKYVAFSKSNSRNIGGEIWLLELETGIRTRLAPDDSITQQDAVGSPDSSRIAFSLNTGSQWELREVVTATGAATTLYSQKAGMWLGDWSADGRFLIYHEYTRIYLLPLVGERKPTLVLDSGRA